MGKTCTELFEGMDCTIIGNAQDEVEGIAYRSDKVKPGDAFFCIVGTDDRRPHPSPRTPSTAARRCSWWSARSTWPTPPTSPRSSSSDYAQGHGRGRRRSFYDDPSRALLARGRHGHQRQDHHHLSGGAHRPRGGKANGRHRHRGQHVIGDVHEKSAHTTPESPDLQHLLARMRDARCDVVAMEVIQPCAGP